MQQLDHLSACKNIFYDHNSKMKLIITGHIYIYINYTVNNCINDTHSLNVEHACMSVQTAAVLTEGPCPG